MKKALRFILPFLFLLIGTGILISWTFYIEPNVNTAKVVVAKKDISFKQKIKEGDLLITEVKKDHLVNDSFTSSDLKLIVGKYASIDIKKGTQIYPNLVDTYDLIPNEKEGEFIAPIPDEWLFAVPGSLRRTFVADFYAVPDEDQAVINALLKEDSHDHEGEQTTETNKDKPVTTDKTTDSVVTNNREPIVKDVRVSSVKDGANKEVKESEESKDNATGIITNMEVIANDEMLSTMREYTEKGYKIYVVYKYER